MKRLLTTLFATGALHLQSVPLPPMQVVTFATEGVDRYADGTVVLDGECYALVWSADGIFEGIAADGSAKDAEDRVAYIGALAKGGRCEPVSFQIPDGLFPGGCFELWLLDTRVFDNGLVTQIGKRDGRVTVAYAAKAVEASVSVGGMGAAPRAVEGVLGGVVAAVPSVDRAHVPLPEISGISFDRDGAGNEVVVLKMGKTVRGVRYGVVGGDRPTLENATRGAVTSGNGDAVTVIVPKRGGRGFFRGEIR